MNIGVLAARTSEASGEGLSKKSSPGEIRSRSKRPSRQDSTTSQDASGPRKRSKQGHQGMASAQQDFEGAQMECSQRVSRSLPTMPQNFQIITSQTRDKAWNVVLSPPKRWLLDPFFKNAFATANYCFELSKSVGSLVSQLIAAVVLCNTSLTSLIRSCSLRHWQCRVASLEAFILFLAWKLWFVFQLRYESLWLFVGRVWGIAIKCPPSRRGSPSSTPFTNGQIFKSLRTGSGGHETALITGSRETCFRQIMTQCLMSSVIPACKKAVLNCTSHQIGTFK